jgi:dephospho-CoA kinase
MTPLIYHVVVNQIKAYEDAVGNSIAWPEYIILTVPLLLENKSKLFQKLVDRILVVDCPEDVQVERVMKRSSLRRKDVEKILAAQCPRYFRILKADDVIHNYDCDPADNQQVVDELHKRYLELAIQAKKS